MYMCVSVITHVFLFSPALSVVPGVFGTQLQYCIDSIKQLLNQALNSPLKLVYSEAFKATVAFVVFLESNPLRSNFADMLQILLAVSHIFLIH